MKKLLIIAGVFTTLFTASCKKDHTEPGPGNGNGKLLKKVTSTEAGQATIYNLTYDGNKRLTSVKTANESESNTFTYDNAGNLVKLETIQPGFKSQYTYAYSNNKPVTGTFKSWQLTAGEPDDLTQDDELTYTVTNEQVSKIHLKTKIEPAEIDFTLSYTDGNLTKVESNGANGYKLAFTYGNKKPAFPKISKYVLDQGGFTLQFAANNEMLTAVYDYPGTEFDYSTTNTYTYDAAGNVLTSTDGTTQLKMDYE